MELLRKHVDAHLLDIDLEYIKSLQDQKIKREPVYNLEEKKLIIVPPEHEFKLGSKESINYEYYSNFKSFRDILTNEISPEDYLDKLAEIERLLDFSKNYRATFNSYLQNDNFQNLEKYSHDDVDYYSNFIQSCKLLKEKKHNSYEEKNHNLEENPLYFTMFSELKITADGKSNEIVERDNTNKYVELKEKLRKSYYKENFLNELYSQKNEDLKRDITKKFSENLRMILPVDYVESIFRGRSAESFKNLDNFMSIYSKKPTVTNVREKNLYENIYSLFSDRKSNQFLSFLYSKNELFKYIFDEFSIDEAETQSIKITEDQFYYGDISKSIDLSPDIRRRTTLYRNFKDIDDFIGHYYFDRVFCLSNSLVKKLTDILLQNKNVKAQKSEDLEKLNELIKKLIIKEKISLMLITKAKKFKLCQVDESENKLSARIGDVEESLKNIKFSFIDKNYLKEIFPELASEENFNSNEYFIVQIKSIRRFSGTEPMSIEGDDKFNKNILIRIPEISMKPLEIIMEHFELKKPSNERKGIKVLLHEEGDHIGKSDSTQDIPKINIQNVFSNNMKESSPPSENNDRMAKNEFLLKFMSAGAGKGNNNDDFTSKEPKLVTFQNQNTGDNVSHGNKNHKGVENDPNKLSFYERGDYSDVEDHLDNEENEEVQKDYFIRHTQTMMTNQASMAKNLKTDNAEEFEDEEEDEEEKEEDEVAINTQNTKSNNEKFPTSGRDGDKKAEDYIPVRITGNNFLMKFNFEKMQLQYHNPTLSPEEIKLYTIPFDSIKEIKAGEFSNKNNKAIIALNFKDPKKKKVEIYVTKLEDYDYCVNKFQTIIT